MLKGLARIIVLLMIMVTVRVQSEEEIGVENESTTDGIIDGKKTVRVQNDLKDGIILYLHCKSKDDDLGQHDLGTGQYQEWSFRDNFADTTLFWCSMFAYDTKMSFEIYNAKIDESKCDKQCYRSIRPDGGYFYDQLHNLWEKRYSWSFYRSFHATTMSISWSEKI
ncbi:S-protein-like 2, partial [Mucuna pruriens]